jgi:hypothetical protein
VGIALVNLPQDSGYVVHSLNDKACQ